MKLISAIRMKNKHIPDVMKTGCFKNAKICQLIADDQITYAIQYLCEDLTKIKQYQDNFAAMMQAEHNKKYKGKLKSRKLGAKLLFTASTFSETLQKAIEGTLSKKDDIKHGRVARLFRKRYFVLSPETGILTYYDNKAKRMLNLKGKKGKNRDIPINKFLSVTASAKRGGCHFQLLLTSGRIYELSASNKATARKWVNALRASLPAENYAAYKIQSVIRMMLIRRKFQVAIKKHRQMLKEAADAKKAAEEARKAEEAKKKISAEELKKQKEERRFKRLERLKRLQEVQDAQKKAVDDAKQEKKSKSATPFSMDSEHIFINKITR